VTQAHRDPPAVPGVHLVKTTTREEDSMASDVVDILQAAQRGSSDTDVGGVEETYRTTLEQDEARRTEHEFFQALGRRVKERCPWADGKRGLAIGDLGTRDGWRFSIYDREGRPFEVEVSFSSIAEVAQQQRKSTLGNFHRVLDNICDRLRDARVAYMARRDAGLELH
jgi:hypothetical protein